MTPNLEERLPKSVAVISEGEVLGTFSFSQFSVMCDLEEARAVFIISKGIKSKTKGFMMDFFFLKLNCGYLLSSEILVP